MTGNCRAFWCRMRRKEHVTCEDQKLGTPARSVTFTHLVTNGGPPPSRFAEKVMNNLNPVFAKCAKLL